MAPRVITFLVILIANIAIGVVWFFFLLLALNGFNSADAQWGIYVFIFIGAAASLVAGLCGAGLVHLLMKRRQTSPLVASLISVPIFVIVGGGLSFLGIVAGAVVADIVRTSL